MKIHLLTKKNKEEIKELLKEVEFSKDGEYVLVERELFENKELILLGYIEDYCSVVDYSDILYFEAIDAEVYGVTIDNRYLIKHKLYEIESMYALKGFFRASKSYVVNIKQIKKIKPEMNRRFNLIMENNDFITVTRSYYTVFKDRLGL